ncbi:hypothetical protein NQ315_001332 [Exocentrus adspersus]|uniref:Multidrug resistance-associated protein lethal(2)03659-like Protein n=1 Tax=Exocentrus adspersus TaxID=1586481 RepID=A0AAV8WFY8_9CUCU|nr:hypothetical protein NQ315_001332 [Exocentrus adspersus]
MDQSEKRKRKANPRETANIFSYFTFGYTLGLFRKGFRKELEEDDIYEVIRKCRSKRCGDKTEQQWNKSASIYRLLWKRFGKTFILIGIATIVWKELYSVLQPYTMSRLISYFEKGQTKISRNSAYYCAGTVIFLNVFGFIFHNNLYVYEYTLAVSIRTSLKSLLYRKSLKLSPAAFSDTNLGNIVTILTRDISAIEENLWLVLDLIVYVIQFLTSCFLLWWKLGTPAFIGIGLLFLALPIQKVTVMMRAFYIHFVIVAIGVLTSKVTFLLLILSYIWLGYTTNTELIFYVLSIFHQLQVSFGIIIPMNLSKIADFRAAFIRLDKMLQAGEIEAVEENLGNPSIYLKDVSVHIRDKEILKDVSLKVTTSSLILVTGAVGSGKSSLLKAILQDYPKSKGDLEVWGSVSYASQDPWLFPASIKQNILFGLDYDEKRYEEVTRVCALNYDLSLLEKGDETVVADRGLNLSKGQQCRINLARAAYRQADIYLLDDALTALDGHVQDYIFDECIKKFLNDKICILVTQNVNHLKQADKVIVMEQGRILISEKPDNIVATKLKAIENMLEITDNENEKESTLLQTEQQSSKKKVYEETKKVGKVELKVYKKYFQYGGGVLIFSSIVFIYVIAQTCESFAEKLITQWIDLQQKVLDLKTNYTINASYYQELVSKKDDTFGVYTILVILKASLALVKFYALLRFCRNASINIHKVMASKVINAVMSFFDTHFIGNILNRFSLDLNNIDESIPFVYPRLFGVLFSSIGSTILIATVNWLFLVPISVLLVVLVLIRMVYIATGRSLKRLESATRSPLVGHINSSLEGLTTIRAFKAEQILKDEFDKHQDLYTSAFFTRVCSSMAFAFFMDLIGSVFTVLVIIRFLFFEHNISAGNVGLALTQVFHLTHHIQWGIQQWAQLENHMTSVERALEYTDIKQEDATGTTAKNWPSDGGIRYDKVTLNYEGSKNPVLKDVSFAVKPKQKIGIVGRTGAGKSSIISTLFRLYEFQGKIWVDGVDISSLSLPFLRSKIAIIPQDPVLFTGTIRDNVDPNKKYTDDKIWKVLNRVKVKDLVPSLDFQIKDKGSGFSSGQRQLLCLARAAIGQFKIVVLDEATANMDPVTDKMLHDVIDEVFSECTILTVAHRLRSILNCDLVMVLDSGSLVEYDDPKKLVEDKTSAFYKMCKEAERET